MIKSPLSYYKFRWVFLAAWLTMTGIQVRVIYWSGFHLQEAIIDSLISNILLAGACLLVINNFRFYLPKNQGWTNIIILNVGLSVIWLVLSRWLIIQFGEQDPSYFSFLDKTLPIRFLIAFLWIGIMAITSLLWYTLEDQKENERRKADAEKLAREAELFKLRQQLQPHFLFNSLNSISALVVTRPEEARHMIQQLSDFLRRTLKKDEHMWVPLAEELQYLQLYLDIEKVRFGYRLTTEVSCDESTKQMQLPALLLQPIVENAIKFGLYDTTDVVIIKIHAHAIEDQLMISVQNPFDPETTQPKGTGFGLNSVQRRLYLLFARNDLLNTQTADHVFITTIKIPQHYD